MSWGVATQNGVSVSLASIVSLSAGVTEFSPIDLFTGGTVGAWYDPSDYTTLFQDSAGTTPVTAVEQPVGLMLDKSQGLVLGSELVTNGDFSGGTTGWTYFVGGTSTASISGGQATITKGSGIAFIAQSLLVQNTVYSCTLDIVSITGTAAVVNANNDAYGSFTTTGTKTFTFMHTVANANMYLSAVSGTVVFDSVSIKRVSGNHAYQATSTSRPVLRSRYNNLTYSEQFDNAVWTKGNSTVTANQTTAPDGTTTADLLYPASSGISRGVYQRPTLSSGTFVTTIYAKVAGKSWVAFVDYGGAAACAWANLSTGAVGTVNAGYSLSVTAAGSGWYRLQFTQTVAVANPFIWLTIVDSDNTQTVTANGTDGIYIWGADLRTGSSAGTYQRIAAATDYATAGFLPYLAFDGTDDSFGTNSINFTATDKMAVVAGYTRSGSTLAMLAESSTGGFAGSFYLAVPYSGTQELGYVLNGSATGAYTTDNLNTPATEVASINFDIGGAALSDEIKPQVNGAIPSLTVLAAGPAGTGNFGNYPLYIGRRANSSLPFNGRMYGLIVAGKTLSASELSATEAWMNSKTGAY